MANLFAMYLKAKGRECDLATLKSDVLTHCNLIASTAPGTTSTDYRVDLAAWNPNRQDWVKEPLGWWLETREGHSELLPVKDGQLTAHAVGRWGAPLHFLDGLRELYPDLDLSAIGIDLTNCTSEKWRCSREETFCVEEVQSCWEGEEVWRWKKNGRLMFDDGKPVAEELLEFTGTRFVMVDGVPLSRACGRAKEHTLCSFEQRPLSELPDSDLGQWLADFHGDDQWQVVDDHVIRAVVVLGDHFIIWQDGPLTETDKKEAVAEYEESMASEDEDDESEVAS